MRAVGNRTLEAINGLYQGSLRVISMSEQQAELLGPHKSSLLSAVKDILTELKNAAVPVEELTKTLNDVADAYEEILDNDSFLTSSAAGTAGGSGGGTGGSSGSGSKGGSAGGQQFDGIPTGSFQNGDTVVKGDNFEQFMSDYYNSENSTYESYGSNTVVETVSPSSIEGIHLGKTEANDPGVFWGMHASSKEFFIETASHIPAVKAALDSGKSLYEVKADPVLGSCASIYFDPANIPRVEKCGGYYSFDGDGRHRILAARELGYDIPVRIVGVRKNK